jgi:polygalacturonase
MWTSAFVNAEGVTGLTISGEGTIDGSGEEWVTNNPMRRPAAPRPAAGAPGAPAAGGAAAAAVAPMAPPPPAPPAATAPPAAGPMVAQAPGAPPAGPRGRGRPRLIGIQNSKEVLVSGLKLHNQAVWCLFVLYSQDVEIDNVNITAEHNIPSSDGIDIDSSKHVHVNNVFIDDDDDCISIKSGKDADGLRVNRPAEDILIENSHFAARSPAASAT